MKNNSNYCKKGVIVDTLKIKLDYQSCIKSSQTNGENPPSIDITDSDEGTTLYKITQSDLTTALKDVQPSLSNDALDKDKDRLYQPAGFLSFVIFLRQPDLNKTTYNLSCSSNNIKSAVQCDPITYNFGTSTDTNETLYILCSKANNNPPPDNTLQKIEQNEKVDDWN